MCHKVKVKKKYVAIEINCKGKNIYRASRIWSVREINEDGRVCSQN